MACHRDQPLMRHRTSISGLPPLASDRCTTRRAGVVLLITLVTIAIAGLILAELARYRLELAMKTADVTQDLQLRWGMLSLRRCLAYQSAKIIDHSSKTTTGSSMPGSINAVVTLSDINFEVTLRDECSKLNLNQTLVRGGREHLLKSLDALTGGGRYVDLRAMKSLEPNRSFSSWGEVFAIDQLPLGSNVARWVFQETTFVTCWGNGRMHYRRTPDRVLALLIPLVDADVVQRFVDVRRGKPSLTLAEMLDEIGVDPSDRQRLESSLADTSDCTSVWIFADSMERMHCELVIAEHNSFGGSEFTRFVW